MKVLFFFLLSIGIATAGVDFGDINKAAKEIKGSYIDGRSLHSEIKQLSKMGWSAYQISQALNAAHGVKLTPNQVKELGGGAK